jgi:hypothetical protein
MQRVRFVTAIAVSSVVCETLHEAPSHDTDVVSQNADFRKVGN